MTKKEAKRQADQGAFLAGIGFSCPEAEQLRKLSKRLHAWNERLCNDTEVDESGKAYVYNQHTGKRYPCRNNGKGIAKRLEALRAAHPEVIIYEQGDPRGCALYVVRKNDLGSRDIEAYYPTHAVPIY